VKSGDGADDNMSVFILGIFGMGPGAPAMSKMRPLHESYWTAVLLIDTNTDLEFQCNVIMWAERQQS